MSARISTIGVLDTYRRSKKEHTILLPLAMLAVIGAAYFILAKTDPTRLIRSDQQVKATPAPAQNNTQSKILSAEAVRPPEINFDDIAPFPDSFAPQLTISTTPEPEISLEPEPTTSSVHTTTTPAPAKPEPTTSADTNFTQWMTPDKMDTYIAQLNKGHKSSFWERGHWIASVEGRWLSGRQEYRIDYRRMPRDVQFAWQFRVNLDQVAFSEQIDTMNKNGYQLIHSQSFQRPDDTKRYQAVWQKVGQ